MDGGDLPLADWRQSQFVDRAGIAWSPDDLMLRNWFYQIGFDVEVQEAIAKHILWLRSYDPEFHRHLFSTAQLISYGK